MNTSEDLESKENSTELPRIELKTEQPSPTRENRATTTRQRFATKQNIGKSILKTEFFLSDEQNSTMQISHDAKFRWRQFGSSFILHLMYFFFIGPMAYMFVFEERLYNFFYNFGFIGLTLKHLSQLIQYTSIVFFFIATLYNSSHPLEQRLMFEQLIFLSAMIFIRITVISAKYATILPWRFQKYINNKLKTEDFDKDLADTWIKQHDELLVRELILSMNRSNYDKSLFQFEFFYDVNEKEDEKLQLQVEKVAEQHNNEPLTRLTNGFMYPPEVDYMLFGDRNIYHGYTLFYDLIKKSNKVESFRKYHLLIAVIVNFMRIALGWIIKQEIYPDEINFYGSSTYIGVAIYMLEFSTFIVGTQNMFQFLNIVTDLNRTIFLLVQASYLMCIQKTSIGYHHDYSKVFPSINFVDPMTISAWSMLRHLIYDYGTPYRFRYQTQLVCYFSINIVQFLLLFFSAISQDFDFFSEYTRTMSYFEIFQTLILLSYCFMKIAVVNEHFDIHKRLIIDNKLIIQTLKLERKYYFDESCRFHSNNIPYQKIVERLKLDFKNDNEKIYNHLQVLNDTYQSVLEKIELDTEHCPYKLLGIKITHDFLLQVTLALGSIIPVALIASLNSGKLTLG